ncbi:phage head morphogenesis protein [Pragia fontium]|uniref:phage head morphogenesis protein n=1 Tax=Pragia fontium TaxID=82985 RepID=UPI0006494AAD|nr:phage head morphogenesis protein [Pragia fontium]AKJ41791.1 phage head morphogenesis protein [Pragia fontium]
MADSILDNALMVQSMLERVKAGLALESRNIGIEIRRAVGAALADYSSSISSRSKADSISKVLKRELKPVLTKHVGLLMDKAEKTALQLADLEYLGFVQLFGENIVEEVDGEELLKALDKRPMSLMGWNGPLYLSEFITAWGVMVLTQVTNEVVRAFANIRTVEDLQASISGAIIEKTMLDYDSMARTALQHAHSVSATEFFMQNPDIVDSEEFAAILDNRTSVICRSLDATVYPVGKGPRPPLHFRCRSRMLPVINKRFRELLSPDASGESVYGEESYYQWLERQTAKRQDIVLGATRGKLFRDGGLTAEQFARLQLHKNFKPMTLEDMRKAAPDAFKRAEIS